MDLDRLIQADADPDVIFCVDADLRITSCNAAWDRFAVANGAPELCRPAPIGHSLFDYIAGPQGAYYEQAYRHVLTQAEPWEHLYECSSPDLYRQFRMRVLPLARQAGLMVINSIEAEYAHNRIAFAPAKEQYRNTNGLIMMCAGCRRTRRNSPGEAIWDWIPQFVERMPEEVSHGFCSFCLKQYYPFLVKEA